MEHALEIVGKCRDAARVTPDAHRSEQRVDRRPRRGKDAVTERFPPARDTGVRVDADEQHVDAGPRPSAEYRRGAVDRHRQIQHHRGDPGDLHGERHYAPDRRILCAPRRRSWRRSLGSDTSGSTCVTWDGWWASIAI